MKSAVIIFHKNVTTYYPKAWVDKCVASIRNQSYKDFDVFELDYGGTNVSVYADSFFSSIKMDNHALAHNYLLNTVFSLDYDCAFNVNIDDWYALNRFEKQIPWIERGYDVVSSNFYRVNEDESMKQTFVFHTRDMVKEAFEKNHNILAHPVLCYSKKFWATCDKLNPSEIPADDFALWKRSYKKGCYKFIILPDVLLFQRIHANNVSKKNGSTNVRVDISRNRKIR